MEKHLILLAICLAFVAGLSLTGANAISPFTEIGNLSAETLNAINDVIDALMVEAGRIDTLQIEMDLAELDINNNKNRLLALENEKSEFNTELDILATTDGHARVIDNTVLFYGSELCELGGGTDAYFEFGNTTLVRHQTDCVSSESGILITLASGADETFNKGDILVLELIFDSGFFWVEVFQNKN